MSDDMCFLSRVEITVGQRLIDLIAKLLPTECDPLSRVEDRRNDLKALLTKVFGHAAKIFDSEFLTKAENAVDKDDIHCPRYYAVSRKAVPQHPHKPIFRVGERKCFPSSVPNQKVNASTIIEALK
jgi:hypothetical protein